MSYNPISLAGKRFLITGAGSGLGRSTSIILAKLGADLILWDIDKDGLRLTKEMCGVSTISFINADLQNIADIKTTLIDVIGNVGKINGFVHLAGRPYLSPLKSINHKTSSDVFNLNTYSAIELAKVFSSQKVYAGEFGSIVLISSVYGLVGSAANVGYAMSKSALHGITKSLSIELAPKKIRVNCIAPGFVKTKMLEDVANSFNKDYNETISKLHPLGLGDPEDVANVIAFLLSDMSKWITGSIISVDGGYTAL